MLLLSRSVRVYASVSEPESQRRGRKSARKRWTSATVIFHSERMAWSMPARVRSR